jgi:Tfp pilus assembly protein PilF
MPDYVEAHNQLGVTLNRLGENELAVESFKNALNFRPNYAKAHNNLGVALNGLGRPEEAVASYENALRIAPKYAEAHNNLGAVLSRLGKSESAIDCFKTALNLDPAYAEAHNNLGIVLTHLGNSKEAVASFNKSIQLRPDHAKAHFGLSKIKTYQPNDPDIVQMLDTLQSDAISSRDQIYLNYSLAKAYADIGDHHNSFTYLAAGNRLDKERSTWSAVSEKELFASIKLKFEHEFLSHVDPKALCEFGSKHPIFVVGMPRSGTTLVEQILASHSQVFGAGELEFLSRSILLDELTLNHEVELEPNIIRNKYLSHLIKLEAGEKYVTDKNPLNFRFIGYILQSFPESKIIHVQRDARATCWSIFRHHFPRFSARQSFIYDLGDVVEYYKLYADLMSFWHKKFPGKIYDLTYELLTENQIKETRSLLEHLGLEWEDRCLEFYKTQRAVKTASSLQVRQEMYRGSSEEWRKFEVHLEPMIEALQMY